MLLASSGSERAWGQIAGMEARTAENVLWYEGSRGHSARCRLESRMPGTFPTLFSVLVKFLAHSMIRNRIRCNGHNSERSSLAYMYVHVGILLGKTHALLQPSYSHTLAKHTVAVCTS